MDFKIYFVSAIYFIFLFSGCQKEAEKQDEGKGTEVQNVQTETAKNDSDNKEELNRELWNAVINKDIEKMKSILKKVLILISRIMMVKHH